MSADVLTILGLLQALWLAMFGWLHVRSGHIEDELTKYKRDAATDANAANKQLWDGISEVRRQADARHDQLLRDLGKMVTKEDLQNCELRLAALIRPAIMGGGND